MIRNITFEMDDTAPATATQETAPTLRLRPVTVSPAEEYALRAGTVRPISNDLAAAILSRKGRAEVTLKGIVVDRTDMGGRATYWHPNSILCNDLTNRDRKLFYVINIHQRDIVHVLDSAGCYLESLPIKERPEVLNTAQQAKAAADHKRQIGRVAAHLQQLHGKDTAERLEELAANSREMQRVVQTLPAPSATPAQPARSPMGEAIAGGTRRINDIRASHASAVALGRAIAANRNHPSDPSDPSDLSDPSVLSDPSEDWSGRHSPQPQTNQQPTAIESW